VAAGSDAIPEDGRRQTWFLDCDGVLLDSNRVKTEAFRSVALRYGRPVAEQVVAHHLAHGGVSRYVKLQRVFDQILGRPPDSGELEELIDEFAKVSRAGLADSRVDPDAGALLGILVERKTRRVVVSGGAEHEVQWALSHHDLADRFDAIHGSPRTKHEIVGAELGDGRDSAHNVLVGDSRLDLEVAVNHGLHAVFVTHWTEFTDWRAFVAEHREVLVVDDLGELRRKLLGEDDGPSWLRSQP
jgi:phosphoglycolate phosphatase-like HAD superfamily hydrolase